MCDINEWSTFFMLKNFGLFLILSIILSACGINEPSQSGPVATTPTQNIIYMDDTPTPPAPTSFPQALPTLNPELNAFSTRILAVMLANADGSNQASVSPEQLIHWVDQANLIYAGAGIRFIFDLAVDVAQLDNDALNRTTGTGDPLWEAAVQEGREYAAGKAGKMVVFFRSAPLQIDTGFRGEDFILMPASTPLACGQPDDTLLAHQIGHYLGLQNTFPQVFPSLLDAEKAYEEHGTNPSFFDGDGLEDTILDVFVDLPEFRCGSKTSISLKGTEVLLPTENIMSFYLSRNQLSPLQVERSRYMLALRVRNGSVLPSNLGVENTVEFEDLKLHFRSWCEPQLQDMSVEAVNGWSGGRYVLVPSGYGSICTYSITAPESAIYELIVFTANGPDRGAAQVLLDNWIIYNLIDMFAEFTMPSGPVSLGQYYMEEGDHTLAFQVINKTLDSANYYMGFDALLVRRAEQ
ncbi:MAG: hypothetical protein C0391_07760 [Anaerolinea sp.]|nr:hypothetical protein [Anaerolinea sp.]